MNLFETVKENVPIRTAAESLGLRIDRSGRVLCPFHNDRHPSMKLYEDHFHCFTCGAHGDVIDLAAQLTGLRPYDAARMLAAQYGLQEGGPSLPKLQLKRKQQSEAQQFREKERLCFSCVEHLPRASRRRRSRLTCVPCNTLSETSPKGEVEVSVIAVLCDYFHLLKDWKARYPPRTPEEEPDPRFVEACHKLELTEYRLDILLEGTEEEKRELISELTEKDCLTQLRERIRRLQEEETYEKEICIAG